MELYKNRLMQLLKKRGYLNLVELQNEIPEFRGNYDWWLNKESNIILWDSMSEIGLICFNELFEEGLFEVEPISPIGYSDSEKWPDFPVGNFPYKAVYEEPHWLPIRLLIIEHPEYEKIKLCRISLRRRK